MHRHASSSTPDDEWYLDTSSALPLKRQHLSAAAPFSFPSAAPQQQPHGTRRHPMPQAEDGKSGRDAAPFATLPPSSSLAGAPRGDEEEEDEDEEEEETSAGTASSSPLLTKARLLQWVSDLLGIHVFSLDQMRRGDVYLRVCGRLFPHAAPLGPDELEWAYRPTSDADVERNIDALRAVFAALGLPRTLLLAGAAAAAAFKAADACAHRELLVFLYATHRMREASAGGAGTPALSMSRPISPELLTFLQSPAMAAMVARCPADVAVSRLPPQATRPSSSSGGGGGPIGDGFEPGCVVECVGMTAQAELNGMRGVCVAVESGGAGGGGGRVQVELPPPHGRMLVFAGCLRVVRAARGCPGVGDEVKVLRVARAAALSPQDRRRSAEACGAGADGVVEAVTTDAAGGAVLRVRVRVGGGGGGAELAVWTHAEHVEPLLRGRYGQGTCVEPPPALVGGGGGGSFHSGAFQFSSPAQVSDELERLSIENSLLQARLEAAERARQGAAASIAAFAMKMRLAFEADLTLERNGHELREREQAAQAESQLAALRQQHATDMAEAKAAWAATVAASAAAAAAADGGEAAGGSVSLQHQHHRLLDALSNDTVLEKANASLHALAARYEATAAEEAERSRAAYASCRGILRALLTTDSGGKRVGAAAGAGAAAAEAAAGMEQGSPILALLRGRGVGVGDDVVLRDALGAYVAHGAHPAGVVNDILTLAVRVKELVEDREQLEAERDAAEGRATERGFVLGAGGEEMPAQQQQPPAATAAAASAVAPPTPLMTPHILLSDVASSFTSTAPPPFPAGDTASGAAGAGAEARRSSNLLSVVGMGQWGGGGSGSSDVGTERKALLSALTGSSAQAAKWLATHEADVAATESACNLRSAASGLPAKQKTEAASLPRLSGNIMDDIDLVRRHMSGHPSQPAKKPAAARTDTLFS